MWGRRGTRSAQSWGGFTPTYPLSQYSLMAKRLVVDFVLIEIVEKQTVHVGTNGRVVVALSEIDQFLGIGFEIEKFRRKSGMMVVFPSPLRGHVCSRNSSSCTVLEKMVRSWSAGADAMSGSDVPGEFNSLPNQSETVAERSGRLTGSSHSPVPRSGLEIINVISPLYG